MESTNQIPTRRSQRLKNLHDKEESTKVRSL